MTISETMKHIGNVMEGLKPTIVMVIVMISYVGINILYKLVVIDGMNLRVVIAYRFIFATAFMAPLAFILERKKMPKITWTILFQALLCGLFGGVVAQTLYLETLALTSATFASAMTNLNPLVTFILSLLFGVERLNWGASGGKAKVIGTVTGVGGAMIVTLLKGNSFQHRSGHVASSHSVTLLGAASATGGSLSFSLWIVIQSKLSQKFPCFYFTTTLMNLVASLFTLAFAFSVNRDWTQWKLGWNIRLLTVLYAGLVPAGISVVAIAWCARKRGPLFVSAFNPLQLLFLAFIANFFLDENLTLGCIIGGVLIVCGLYAVLWGKGQDLKNMKTKGMINNDESVVSPNLDEIVVKSPVVNVNDESIVDQPAKQ